MGKKTDLDKIVDDLNAEIKEGELAIKTKRDFRDMLLAKKTQKKEAKVVDSN